MRRTTIRSRRKQRGWSQAELARRTGMHPADISRIESGRLQPYPGQIRKIESALKIDPADSVENQASGGKPRQVRNPSTTVSPTRQPSLF